jgi:hypothetical protein
MRFKTATYVSWQPWYAWRPAKVGQCLDEENHLKISKWAWLEVVERMRRHNWADWEYREVQSEKTGTGNN